MMKNETTMEKNDLVKTIKEYFGRIEDISDFFLTLSGSSLGCVSAEGDRGYFFAHVDDYVDIIAPEIETHRSSGRKVLEFIDLADGVAGFAWRRR